MYTPYGEASGRDRDNRIGYTGHVEDANGLIFAGARYYDPMLGRFLSTDSVGFTEKNMMSFNRYAYANNNPFRFVDPDGRESFLVSRPLGGDSKIFSHNFVVSNANFMGDPNAVVYSYGQNNQGNTGRVDGSTKGFSEGTSQKDQDFWKQLVSGLSCSKSSLENTMPIGAADATVDKVATSLKENTDYAAAGVVIGTGTNSNSAASAVANTAQGSPVAIPGGSRWSPGASQAGRMEFEKNQ